MDVDAGMGGENDFQSRLPAVEQHESQHQSGASSGPRLAPTYRVIEAILEKKEDGPGPRCGHTLTPVAAVGEDGSPGYIGPRLILFGGATALEGNSGASGPQTSSGAGISTAYLPRTIYCILDFGCLSESLTGSEQVLLLSWRCFVSRLLIIHKICISFCSARMLALKDSCNGNDFTDWKHRISRGYSRRPLL